MKRIAWTKLLFTAALFTGCTTAQVRWDAIGVREQVMKFYNDEIMDNLINMKNDLPYVHVDVSTVSAAAASQLSGSVGAGNTRTFGRPGALKWRAGRFYYIANSKANQAAYTNLCMALLKQGRTKATGAGTSEEVKRTLNEFQDLKARESLPQTLTAPH